MAKTLDARDKASGSDAVLRTARSGHDEKLPRPSPLRSMLFALIAAAVPLFASSLPASADLKLCNRMSYVIEAAIGIDDKSATATRGWFRIDPAACRVVLQGTLDRRPYPAQCPRARRLRRLADPAERQRHALRRSRQFRHRGRPPVPRPARRRRPSPRSLRPAPTTAISSPISPKTANMTTIRRVSPPFSGCW